MALTLLVQINLCLHTVMPAVSPKAALLRLQTMVVTLLAFADLTQGLPSIKGHVSQWHVVAQSLSLP